MDSQKDEIQREQSEEHRRTERRLARGLEEVSHLFLSQSAGRPFDKTCPPNTPSAPSHSEQLEFNDPVVLRASSPLDRDALLSLLNKNAAVLEEGVRVIDSRIPCDPLGPIDILAVDGADQLVVIDIDTVQNNDLFLRGAAHCDWFTRNGPIVRRMYHGRIINFSAQPRLFLVAPSFSILLKCVAQRAPSPSTVCFSYRTAAIPGGLGVLFERI